MRKNEVPAWFMVNVKVAMVKTYRIEKDAWKKIVQIRPRKKVRLTKKWC
jgi:hypothetical protein